MEAYLLILIIFALSTLAAHARRLVSLFGRLSSPFDISERKAYIPS